MHRMTHLGAIMTVLFLVACGEGADTAPTDTAKSSKQLKDLTADDVQSTCESLATRVTLSKEDACEFFGVVSSAAGESCQTVKDECLAAAAAEPSTQGQGADANCLPPTERRAGCTATVAEYEVCLLAQTEVLRSLTCTSPLSTLEAPLPACELITQKCPSLAHTDEGGGAGEGEGEGQGTDNP